MHHYETVQFLLDHGAHVDDESGQLLLEGIYL